MTLYAGLVALHSQRPWSPAGPSPARPGAATRPGALLWTGAKDSPGGLRPIPTGAAVWSDIGSGHVEGARDREENGPRKEKEEKEEDGEKGHRKEEEGGKGHRKEEGEDPGLGEGRGPASSAVPVNQSIPPAEDAADAYAAWLVDVDAHTDPLRCTAVQDVDGRWLIRDAAVPSVPMVFERALGDPLVAGGTVTLVLPQFRVLMERYGMEARTRTWLQRATVLAPVPPTLAASTMPSPPTANTAALLSVAALLRDAAKMPPGAAVAGVVGRVHDVSFRQAPPLPPPPAGAPRRAKPAALFRTEHCGVGHSDRLLHVCLGDRTTCDEIDVYLDLRDRAAPFGLCAGAVLALHSCELRFSPQGRPYLASTTAGAFMAAGALMKTGAGAVAGSGTVATTYEVYHLDERSSTVVSAAAAAGPVALDTRCLVDYYRSQDLAFRATRIVGTLEAPLLLRFSYDCANCGARARDGRCTAGCAAPPATRLTASGTVTLQDGTAEVSALVDGEHLLTLLGLSVAERNELANLMTRIGALTVKRADGTDDAGAAELLDVTGRAIVLGVDDVARVQAILRAAVGRASGPPCSVVCRLVPPSTSAAAAPTVATSTTPTWRPPTAPLPAPPTRSVKLGRVAYPMRTPEPVQVQILSVAEARPATEALALLHDLETLQQQ